MNSAYVEKVEKTVNLALAQEKDRIQQIVPREEHESDCDQCNGDGYIITEDDVRICDCKRSGQPMKRLKAYLNSVSRCSLKNGEEVKAAQLVDPTVGKIPLILRAWAKHKNCKGVLMQGPSGTGKTCAAHYIAKRIMKTHELRGRFVDVRYLSMMVPRMVDDGDAADYIREVEDWVLDPSLVLVLDDIGGEAARDSVRSRIHDYLNERFLQRSWTIVTTNLSRDELTEQYGEVVVQRCLAGSSWMFPIRLEGENLRATQPSKAERDSG